MRGFVFWFWHRKVGRRKIEIAVPRSWNQYRIAKAAWDTLSHQTYMGADYLERPVPKKGWVSQGGSERFAKPIKARR